MPAEEETKIEEYLPTMELGPGGIFMATSQASRGGKSTKAQLLAQLARLLPPGAKLAQEVYNKLCADDADCTDEAKATIDALKKAYDIGSGQNLGVRLSDIAGKVEQGAVGSGYRATSEYINPALKEFSYQSLRRVTDSESQILEYYRQQLQNNPVAEGTIRLFTERHPCPTCVGVINQFVEKFPNIQLYVYYLKDQ